MRHGGTVEEFSLADQDAIEQVIIPLMNVNRKTLGNSNLSSDFYCLNLIIKKVVDKLSI